MKAWSIGLMALALALALAMPAVARAKGGGHSSDGRIGSGPGSEREDADKASAGKTAKLPSNVRQVEHATARQSERK